MDFSATIEGEYGLKQWAQSIIVLSKFRDEIEFIINSKSVCILIFSTSIL